MTTIAPITLEKLFHEARTANVWSDEPISDGQLYELYDAVKFAPTSANAGPARFVFVKSPEAKERLLKVVSEGNQEKTRTAPVTVIVAYDTEFYQHLPRLFPIMDIKPMFEGNQALAQETAFRNSSLQGAYLIIAARALGLDAGPMSGFDAEKLNAEFFSDGKWKANFLVNLGHAAGPSQFPRLPRLEFHEAASIL